MNPAMERSEALGQMRAICDELGQGVTRLHPLVSRLNAPAAQGEIRCIPKLLVEVSSKGGARPCF